MTFKLLKKALLLASLVTATCANAIEINSMMLIADSNGEATFTIKNTQETRIFMNVGMQEMRVVDGKITRTPYSRENIGDWKIDVRPAKTIIDVNHIKDFKVSMKCGDTCEDKDEVFQIGFVPTPYFEEGEEQQTVAAVIGFGAVFLKPGSDKPIQQSSYFDGENVVIENKGDSFFQARISNCAKNTAKENVDDCTKNITVLPGRKYELQLPAEMRKNYVDVYLTTNRDKYKENLRLVK
ncbi:hypothetical protein V4T45_003991 [Vibrio vulnificus]|nr:hypothetical protein [Vibrio vulnificus]ELR8772622.1 hypothetical protein [Vibrio vulnificus]ELV8635763.1 hypothetical protein [Vibrio vulnificus]